MSSALLTSRLGIVAMQLEPLLGDVVFVGGAVIPLLLTDQGARDVRTTDDVDVVVAISSLPKWYQLEQTLKQLGFSHAGNGAPICRFTKGSLLLDVMPTDATVLGFGNRWYHEAVLTAQPRQIEARQMRIISAPCFIATKLEAYCNRGNDDLIVSHDIEDIVAVLDGRPELMNEVKAASVELRDYVCVTMSALTGHRQFSEAMEGHVAGDSRRTSKVVSLWHSLATR
jgi:predicted nucleotidyltransferase